MYLRHRPWTRKETLRFALAVSVLPWAVLAVALRLLITGPIQLEMGLLGAGFLAIIFTVLTALSVWGWAALKGLEIPDYFRLLRAILWTAVAVSSIQASWPARLIGKRYRSVRARFVPANTRTTSKGHSVASSATKAA